MSAMRVAIIDYGSGNLRSAAKAFAHVLAREHMPGEVFITSRADEVRRADKIVLPGQGAFGDCIAGLKKVDGMIAALDEKVRQGGAPFFGICVGMQLMATRGLEFGEHAGLNWIPGDVVKMTPSDPALKIPHMGWNAMAENKDNPHSVLQSVTKNQNGLGADFYFVHSFVFDCKDAEHVAGWCDYGGKFAAMVAKDNMIGTQFHPEKSQQAGLDLIAGFLRWKP
jgi:imidazole glycerol-phosphate synthase subunit HisH